MDWKVMKICTFTRTPYQYLMIETYQQITSL